MSTQSTPDMVRAFGRIGLLSFGGPAAQIAIMHDELVERLRAHGVEVGIHEPELFLSLPGGARVEPPR